MNTVAPRRMPAVLAGAALVLVLHGVQRPGFWIDEAATVAATRRSWSQLWPLLSGNDAPLVPYYALMKLVTPLIAAVTSHGPVTGWAAGPADEVVYRLPSVLAACLAAWLMTAWLQRVHSGRLALAAWVMLVAAVGFSRYAQEARPYALTMLVAVVATTAWWQLAHDRRRRWVGLYAAALVLLLLSHLLAAMLMLVVHLAAATVAPQRRPLAAVERTLHGMVLGLLVALPYVLLATNGQGGLANPTITLSGVGAEFMAMFASGETGGRPLIPLPIASLIPLFGLVGLTCVRPCRHTALARLAACWALVPLLLWLPLVLARPNLLIYRYVLFSLPGWAILAGIGLLTCGDAARRLVRSAHPVAGPAAVLSAAAVPAVVCAGLVTAVLLTQAPSLRAVRDPAGHGEDMRPAIEAAGAVHTRHLPLVVGSRFGSAIFDAYAPQHRTRLIGLRPQFTETEIWPTVQDSRQRGLTLRAHPTIGLLMRTPRARDCPPRVETSQQYATRCMPSYLSWRGYRVLSTAGEGRHWLFVVLTREIDEPMPEVSRTVDAPDR